MKRYITECINDMIKKYPEKKPAFECLKARYCMGLVNEFSTLKEIVFMVESFDIFDFDMKRGL
jgi:hypothetical protein